MFKNGPSRTVAACVEKVKITSNPCYRRQSGALHDQFLLPHTRRSGPTTLPTTLTLKVVEVGLGQRERIAGVWIRVGMGNPGSCWHY